MEMGDSSEFKIGLKFGQKIYFGDVGVGAEGKPEGGSSSPASGGGGGLQKKGQGQQPARCQVEGCNLDLSDAKTYYSRHKVCGVHSKTPKVVVNGLQQRFCQQCSRFHLLPEFDQGKRSCRRRLAGHNERRRKPSSGTLLAARYGSLPSSIFEKDGSSRGGFLMDFSAHSRVRVQWPNTRAPARVGNNFLAAVEKLPPLPWQSSLDNPPPYVPPGGCFTDSNCALSLLSNHSSGSRNQTLSLEYYAHHDAGAPMVQPAAGTMFQGHFSPAAATWGYDTGETHMGVGQVLQPGYSGEPGLGHLSGKQYDSSAEHIHWSL